MTAKPSPLFADMGPAIRLHRYWSGQQDRTARLIASLRGWNFIQLGDRIHLHRQGEGAFDPARAGPGQASVMAAVEALVREDNPPAESPLFRAFDHVIFFRSGEFVAVPPRSAGNPVRASGLASLLTLLQADRDRTLRIVLHVGLAKTGTTYLQQHVFPRISGIHFVSMQSYFLGSLLRKAIHQGSLQHVDEIRDEFLFYLSTFDEKTVLISDEVMTTTWVRESTIEAIFLFLKALFPGAEILLALREQVSMLRSLYLQSIRGGWNAAMSSVARWERRRTAFAATSGDPLPGLDLGYFDYTALIELLEMSFAKVRVVLFEEFAADPKAFAVRIAAELGGGLLTIRENPALGRIGVLLFRIINAVLRDTYRGALAASVDRLDRRVHWAFDPIAPGLQAAMRRRFAASNKLLREKYRVDIDRYWQAEGDGTG